MDANKIKDEILNIKRNLLNYTFKKSTGQLEKTHEIKIAKKNIARLKTQMSQIKGEENA